MFSLGLICPLQCGEHFKKVFIAIQKKINHDTLPRPSRNRNNPSVSFGHERLECGCFILRKGKIMFHNDILKRPVFGQRITAGHNSRGHKPDETSHEFNYGRQLPWHTHGATEEYRRTLSLVDTMYRRQMALSKATWALEMALKAVRDARTEDEFWKAQTRLRSVRCEHDLIGIDNTRNVANMPNEPEDYVYGENI